MQRLEADGFVNVPALLDEEEVASVEEALAGAAGVSSSAARRRTDVYALRNLLTLAPYIRRLVHSPKIQRLLRDALGAGTARPVRGTLFDKTPEANWLVPWHQDLTICVNERIEVPGFGPWTLKAGVLHVQPPVEILEAMVSLRVHLDDCGDCNGPLRVLPGTHRFGRLSAAEVQH